MAAPTLVASGQTAWNTTTTPKTASVTVAVGDILVVKGATENGLTTLATPTGGSGFTWTLRQSYVRGNTNPVGYLWAAVATVAQTFTLSLSASSPQNWGFGWEVWRGSDGVGASAQTPTTGVDATTGAPSLAITTGYANSALSVISSDWNAVSGTRTYRAVNGFTPAAGGSGESGAYPGDGAIYGVYSTYYPDAGTAGSKTVGMTAPTGQKYVVLAVEIRGSAGGSGQSVAPSAVSSGEALGSPSLGTAVSSQPAGVASGQGLGSPVLSTGVTLAPSAVGSSAAPGMPVLSAVATTTPDSISSGMAAGSPSLTVDEPAAVEITDVLVTQSLAVTPTGVTSGAALGSPALTSSATVVPTGVSTGTVVGSPVLSQSEGATVEITDVSVELSFEPALQTLSPAGIPTGAAIGSPTLSTAGAVVEITDVHVALSETGSRTVVPAGIGSAAALGTPTLSMPGAATVEITSVLVAITTVAVIATWKQRVGGVFVDPDWQIMERRSGVWVLLDS